MRLISILTKALIVLASTTTTAADQMYWTDSSAGKIAQANIDGTNAQDVLINQVERPRALVLDTGAGKMYWTDTDTDKIQRANFDGTDVQDLITAGPNFPPSAVTLDLVSDKMYWAQIEGIRRANLDGSNVEDLVASGAFLIQGLALDLTSSKLYWHAGSTLFRADLGGTNVEILLNTNAFRQTAVTLDTVGGKLYWAVGFLGGLPGKIQRANLDGSQVEDLLELGTVPATPRITLDRTAGKLYWSDAHSGWLSRANLDGSNVEELVAISDFQVEGPVLDSVAGKMYWSEVDSGIIRRANLDGSNVEDLVSNLTAAGEVAIDAAADAVYWPAAGKLQRAALDGSNIEDLLVTLFQVPAGITIDPFGQKMYWADPGTQKIQRGNLDGTDTETIVSTGLDSPDDVALDTAAGKIYWTDSAANTIQRANLDGSQIEPLITTGLAGPDSLALDIAHGKIYWTERSRRIRRANLNGTLIEDLQTTTSFAPRGIALDPVRGKIYWGLATSSPPIASGVIQSADLNGQNVENVVSTGGGIAFDIMLDRAQRTLYWARGGGEFTAPAIARATLEGSGPTTLVATGFPQSVALDSPPEPLPATGLLYSDAALGYDGYAKLFPLTPQATAVGKVGSEGALLKDIATDPFSGRAYTIGTEQTKSGQKIYTIDPLTGRGFALPGRTFVSAPGLIWGLAFDDQGILYGGGLGVFTIDKYSGRATPLATFSQVPVFIFGMADFPGGAGFISTGVILVPDVTVPYIAFHGPDGNFLPDGVFLIDDPTVGNRMLLDIGVSATGALYGYAVSEDLFFQNNQPRKRPGKRDVNLLLAQASALSQLPAVDAVRQELQDKLDPKRLAVEVGNMTTDLVLIDLQAPLATLTPGAPIDGFLLGLGSSRTNTTEVSPSRRN